MMIFRMSIATGYMLLGLFATLWLHDPTHAQTVSDVQPGQSLTVLRATELRADKLSSAKVVGQLAAGAEVRLVSSEGGWTLVEAGMTNDKPGASKTGWLRASAVSWQSTASVASRLPGGREARGNTALTLGVRSLTPRVNRHALIIGVSRYADPATPPLPGARIDKQSATQMAQAMQVPTSNIRYLQDEQATGDSIRKALHELTSQVEDGDRVFIHYSGHGTRYNDPVAGGCVEALLAYDGGQSGTITNREMADMLKTITNKTDKLFVMYDACHSGGVVRTASSVRTRGFGNANDEGLLRPKFSSITEECGRPVNVKTRNLVVEATVKGALPQDIIHVSASRDNEISFDDELKGGLATQFMRDCMLRDAKDLDNSGAITIDEIRQCAQEKINKRMANDVSFKPHNLVLNGNAAFVPAWFSQAGTAAVATPAVTPTPQVPAINVVPLTGEQALRQLHQQADAKRHVQVALSKNKLKIGKDKLDFTVQSDKAGYVYVAMAGSDNKSLYLLFPNDLDKNNRIEAGQQMVLPREGWSVTASGPPGLDTLLVLVTDAPRDLEPLSVNKAGPFVASLNDQQGRARLGVLMTTSKMATSQSCSSSSAREKNAQCSDAYGATMVALEELK